MAQRQMTEEEVQPPPSPPFPAHEKEYKTMIVTPEGSIIRIGGKQPKPETDENWVAREAKRQRRGE